VSPGGRETVLKSDANVEVSFGVQPTSAGNLIAPSRRSSRAFRLGMQNIMSPIVNYSHGTTIEPEPDLLESIWHEIHCRLPGALAIASGRLTATECYSSGVFRQVILSGTGTVAANGGLQNWNQFR